MTSRLATDAIAAALRLSREQFEAFASSVDELPVDDTNAMQMMLMRWQHSMFGYDAATHDLRMFAGIVEELGETFDAENAEAALDGLGDLCGYVGHLLVNNRLAIAPVLDLARVFASAGGEVEPRKGIGLLGHAVLKHAEKIRGFEDDDLYRAWLVEHAAMCIARAIDDVEQIFAINLRVSGVYCTVGGEVLQRKRGDKMIPDAPTLGPDAEIAARQAQLAAGPRVSIDQATGALLVDVAPIRAREAALAKLAGGVDALGEAEKAEGPGDFEITTGDLDDRRMPFDPGGEV